MLVQVTEEDIEDGVQCNICMCPVAQAIKRIVKPYCEVTVGQIIRIKNYKTHKVQEIPLSEEIEEVIKNYDLSRGMKPFQFEINIDSEHLKCPKKT